MDSNKTKIKFPFACPVCGKSSFTDLDEEDNEEGVKYYKIDAETKINTEIDEWEARYIHCEYCGWEYDLTQVSDHNVPGKTNKKSVNDLKKEYLIKINQNPEYKFDDELRQEKTPHMCPVCGKYEFTDEISHDICEICGWEDDGTEFNSEDEYSDANKKTINEAKLKFQKAGL